MTFVAIVIFDKLSFEQVKSQLINRVMANLPKMRMRIVNYLGDLYWAEVPIEEASKLVKKAPDDIHDEQGIDKFLEKILPPRIKSDMP